MGCGTSKNGEKEEILKMTPDGRILKFKTSIYGWGKLEHPIKPQGEPTPKKKKKTKWVDPLEGQNSEVKGQRSLMSQRAKSAEALVTKPKVDPETTRLQQLLKRKSVPNTAAPSTSRVVTKPTDTGWRNAVNTPTTSKVVTPIKIDTTQTNRNATNSTPAATKPSGSGWRTGIVNSTTSKSVTPIKIDATKTGKNQVTSTTKSQISTTKNYFYGQYRCPTCQKYWRSALAQDGVSQSCTKCPTPTFPRK